MTGAKAPFRPRTPGHVGMYVCGVTVYDLCHIGHARSAIVFDVLRRYLESGGLIVTYVRNFTDIDDKIIRRAREDGIGWREVASGSSRNTSATWTHWASRATSSPRPPTTSPTCLR
jgi:cysteinyl-tRNA synthetase